jgi:hypothetical protein
MKGHNKDGHHNQLTKKRIAELQWKKGIKQPEERIGAFIVDVLYGDTWTKEKYNSFSEEERKGCEHFFEATLNSLGGDDYDRFLRKVLPFLNEPTRQNIEEVHYVTIANAINKLTKENNRFPARCEIVAETGYSHKTVNDCLSHYKGSNIQKGREEELTIMREKMISMCYKLGVNGNIQAAKLFIEATAERNMQIFQRNEQNNFIQINGCVITADQLKRLPDDKQAQINDILLLLNRHSLQQRN